MADDLGKYLTDDSFEPVNKSGELSNYLDEAFQNPDRYIQPGEQSFRIPGYKRDDYTRVDYLDPFGDINEQRALSQSGAEQMAYFVPKILQKAVGEVAKMPGYLYGLADWASTGFEADEVFRMADNAWINAVEQADDYIKREVMPIYKEKAVEEGGFWKQVGSPEFWASEASDAIGFFASMFVPGQALKALKLSGKIGRTLGVNKRIADNAELWTATMANTVFESAAETAGIIDNLKPYYAEKVKNGEMTQAEANQVIGEAGSSLFNTNLAILIGPNFIMNRNILGRFTLGKSTAKSAIAKATADVPELMSNKAIAKEVAKRVTIGAVSEGFWEEGSQFAAEEYFSKKAKQETDSGLVDGLLEEYWDMLGNTEGQKSIFLGALLGIGGGGIGAYRKSKSENKQVKSLNELLDKNYAGFVGKLTDLYKKGEQGEILMENGKPIKDTKKEIEMLNAMSDGFIETALLENFAARAAETGSEEAKAQYRELFNTVFTKWALPYIQQPNGAEVLKAQIKKMEGEVFAQMKSAIPDANVAQDLMEQVDKLDKRYSHIQNYSNDFFKFTTPKGMKAKRTSFIEDLKHGALLEYSREQHYARRVSQLKADLAAYNLKEDSKDVVRERIEKDLAKYEKKVTESRATQALVFDKAEQQEAWSKYIEQEDAKENQANEVDSKSKKAKDIPVTVSDEVKRLYDENIEYETLTTESGSTSIKHKGTISFKVFDEEGNEVDESKLRKNTGPTDGSLREWKVERINENNGDLQLSAVDNSNTKATLTSGGTLRTDTGAYRTYTPIQGRTPAQTRKDHQYQAILAMAKRGIDLYTSRIKIFTDRVTAHTAEVKKLQESMKRAMQNKSGKTTVTIDGKKVLRNVAQIEKIIVEIKAENKEYRAHIKAMKERKTQLEKGTEEVKVTGFNIEWYEQQKAELDEQIAAGEEALSDADIMIEILQDQIDGWRKWVKGLYTQMANIAKKNHGAEAYAAGVMDDILSGEIEDKEFMDVYNNYRGAFEKIELAENEIEIQLSKIAEAEAVISALQKSIQNNARVTRNYYVEYLNIMKVENEEDYARGKGTVKVNKETITVEDRVPGFKSENDQLTAASDEAEHGEDNKNPRAPFKDITSWFKTTGNHRLAMEREDEDQLRWYEFLEKFNYAHKDKMPLISLTVDQALAMDENAIVRKQMKFWVPSQKSMMTADAIEALGDEVALNEAREDIKLYVYNRFDSAPLLYDGNIVYTSMALPERKTALGFERFSFRQLAYNKYKSLVREAKAEKKKEGKNPKLSTEEKKDMEAVSMELAIDIFEKSLEEYTNRRNELKEAQQAFIIGKKHPGRKVPSKEPGNVVGSIVLNNSDLQGLEVHVEKTEKGSIDIYGKSYPAVPGASYVKNMRSNRAELILQQTLSESDQETVMKLLQAQAGFKEGKSLNEYELRIALQTMVYVFFNPKVVKGTEFQMYFKTDANNETKVVSLVFGNQEITSQELVKGEGKIFQDLRTFIANKYHNIDSKALEADEYIEIFTKDGKLTKKVWTKKEGGYIGYLFSTQEGREPKAKVDLKPLAGKSFKQAVRDPQYMNASFEFVPESEIKAKKAKKRASTSVQDDAPAPSEQDAPPATETPENAPAAASTPAFKLAAVNDEGTPFKMNGNIFQITEAGAVLLEGNNDQHFFDTGKMTKITDASKLMDYVFNFGVDEVSVSKVEHTPKPTSKVDVPATETEAPEVETAPAVSKKPTKGTFDPKAGETRTQWTERMVALGAQEELINDVGDAIYGPEQQVDEKDDSIGYGLTNDLDLQSDINPGEKIRIEKETAWLKKKFPGLPVHAINTLIAGKYGGVFTKHAVVVLSQAASSGTGFHEGWHVFSQMFTSKEDLAKLYDDTRSRLGETEITVKGEVVKGKDMTDAQIEEYIAEEFRVYVMSGGKYRFNSQDKFKKGIFATILRWVKYIADQLFGTHKPGEMEKAFKTLNEGEFSMTQALAQPNRNMYRINDKIDEELSQKLIKDVNVRFFNKILSTNTSTFDKESLLSIDAEIDNVYEAIKADYAKNRSILGGVVVGNWEDLKAAHEDFIKQFGVKIERVTDTSKKEEDLESVTMNYVEETSEEDTVNRDSVSNVPSNLISAKANMPKPLSLLIAGLPVVEPVEGTDKYDHVRDEAYGTVATARFHSTMNLLHTQLSKLTTYKEMVQKMHDLKEEHPHIGVLLKWLGSWSATYALPHDVEGSRLQAMFFTQFAKNKNNPVMVYVRESGNIGTFSAITETARQRIESDWRANAYRHADRATSLWKNTETGEVVLDTAKYFKVGEWEFSLADLSIHQITPEQRMEVLEMMGITFAENPGHVYAEGIPTRLLTWIVNNAKSGNDFTVNEFYSEEGLKVKGELSKALKYAAAFREDMTELQFFNQEGKTEYSITENSHLSNTINRLNNTPFDKNKETGEDLETRTLPEYLRTPYTENSLWRKHFEEGGELTLHILRGMKSYIQDGTDMSTVAFADYLSSVFNAALDGVTPYARSADRKLEYAVSGIPTNMNAGKKEYVKTFTGYLKDELAATIDRAKNGKGKNLANYGKNALQLRVFSYIFEEEEVKTILAMSSGTDPIVESAEYVDNNLKRVEKALGKKFDETVSKNFDLMREQGLIRPLSKGKELLGYALPGISIEHVANAKMPRSAKTGISPANVRRLVEAFTYAYDTSIVEQTKLLIGDFANYANPSAFNKRTNGATSTRQNMFNEPEMNKNWDVQYPKFGQQKYGTEMNIRVYEEAKGSNDTYQKSLPKESSDAYIGYDRDGNIVGFDSADAQAKATLDFYREIFIKNGGRWDTKHERTYQHEMQTLAMNILTTPKKELLEEEKVLGVTAERYYELFGKHFSVEQRANFEENQMLPEVPMFKGTPIDAVETELAPLPPLKTQGFGPITSETGVYAAGFFKHSLAPLLPTAMDRGSTDYVRNLEMLKDGVGAYTYPTALKAAYNMPTEGNPADMTMSMNDFGIQTEVKEDLKGKATASTQKRRLEFTDVFSREDIEEEKMEHIRRLKEEHIDLTEKLIDKKKAKLMKDLGLRKVGKVQIKDEDGLSLVWTNKYELDPTKADNFKMTLKRAFDQRSMPSNVIEGVDVALDSNDMLLDTLMTRDKIDNVLTALVRSRIIRPKVNGEMLVQETSVGYDIDLKFYRKGKDGKTQPMEVMIPLPQELLFLVEQAGGWQKFNQAIEEGRSEDVGIPKELTLFSGNRIPSKGLASLEAAVVKRYLPPHAGARIVLPKEIVVKSGSDYDVDKLTTYLKNFNVKDGKVSLVEYRANDPSVEAIENRLNDISSIILLDEVNYEALLMPDSTSTLKAIADEVAEGQPAETWADTTTFWFNAQKARVFWAGKTGVALTAVHNTSHSTSQQVPLRIVDPILEIHFPGEHGRSGEYSIGHHATKNGTPISRLLGEFLSAYVDVAKDPFVFHLNATTSNFPIYSFLLRVSADNAPTDIELIAKFMTHPAIKEFTQRSEKSRALFLRNRGEKEADIVNSMVGGKSVRKTMIYKKYREHLKTEYPNTEEGRKDKAKAEIVLIKARDAKKFPVLTEAFLKRTDKAARRDILDMYLQYKAAADKLSKLQSATRSDSSFPNHISGLKVVEGNLSDIYQEDYFNRDDVANYVNTTEIAPFHQMRTEATKMFDQFLVDKIPEVSATMEYLRKIYKKAGRNNDDIEKALSKFKADFVAFMLQTTKVDGAVLEDKFEQALTGKNSVADILVTMKSIYPENSFLLELRAEFKEYIKFTKTNTEIDTVKMISKRLMLEEQNSVITGWKELIESEEEVTLKDGQKIAVRDFAIMLMKQAIIESGTSSSYMSFNDMIPERMFREYFSGAVVDQFMDDMSKMKRPQRQSLVDGMLQQFFRNNAANDAIVPRMRKDDYNYVNNTMDVYIHSPLAHMPFIHVVIDAVSQGEAKRLERNSERVPRVVVLMEQMGPGENGVHFAATHTKGDSMRFKEYHRDAAQESFLEQNKPYEAKELTEEDKAAYTQEEQDEMLRQANEEAKRGKQSYMQTENTGIAVDPELNGAMMEFLAAVGIPVRTVETIYDNHGMPTNHVAQADMLRRVVDVVDGKDDITTLPEEASHVFVEMLGKNHPTFTAMMRNIENYAIFQEVVEEYGDEYKGDMEMIKKEAIGKLISLHMTNNEGRTLAEITDQRQQAQLKTWWRVLWENIKRIFGGRNMYAEAALQIMNQKLDDLQDIENITPELEMSGQAYNQMSNSTKRRLAVQDDVAQAEAKQRYRSKQTFPQQAMEQIKKVTVEPIETLSDATQAVLRDFEHYFPQYADFSQEEKLHFIESMYQGELEINC